MITLTLSNDESEILLEILRNSYSDLREEIVGTAKYEYKEMLKTRKEVISHLIDMLDHSRVANRSH